MAKAQAQEPSMEEILASIRRIIADEETAPKGADAKAPPPAEDADETISEDDLDKLFASAGKDEPAAAPEPDDDDDDDVLELTEEADVDPPLVEGFGDATDLAFEEIEEPAPVVKAKAKPIAAAKPEPAPVARVESPAPPPVVQAAVAPPPPKPAPAPMTAAAAAAFDPESLISHSTEGMVSSAFNDLALTVLNRNARTLEDLVQDMLRPMLKGWLDQNLPIMVERLVKAEIERVTRGR